MRSTLDRTIILLPAVMLRRSAISPEFAFVCACAGTPSETGWYLLEDVEIKKNAQARDAAAWKKVLDQNAADRATADLATNRA